MKTTRCFEEQVLRKRPYLRREWCELALREAVQREIQPDGLSATRFSFPSWASTYEVALGVVVDFDAERRLAGIDIDHASQIVDLSRLEATALPVTAFALAGAEA